MPLDMYTLIDVICFLLKILQSSCLQSVSIGWDGGVYVQTCGHTLHIDCHKSYMESLRVRESLTFMECRIITVVIWQKINQWLFWQLMNNKKSIVWIYQTFFNYSFFSWRNLLLMCTFCYKKLNFISCEYKDENWLFWGITQTKWWIG